MTHSAPFCIEITRGDFTESRHIVHAVAVDADGKIIAVHGDSNFPTYVRSTLKPFQALPLLESGAADRFGYNDEELALCCASHVGLDFHVETAKSLLSKAGFTVADLQNRKHHNHEEKLYQCVGPADDELATLKHDCSGKHSGMLAAAKQLGQNPLTYREPDGILQKQVFAATETLSGISQKDFLPTLSPDGCGTPVFQLPLAALAKLYGKLANQNYSGPHAVALKRLAFAMTSFPDHVGGPDEWNSFLMREIKNGLVAKNGAEGVFLIGLANGTGIAMKVEDGNGRAWPAATLAILREIGAIDSATTHRLKEHKKFSVRNVHGLNVGKSRLQA